MNDEINFVNDLALILISAGIFTILCRALKHPLILGYIIAGFLISPNLGLVGIMSQSSVDQWSEIGIIFLMFGLGLEFSFKKLLGAGAQALVTAGAKFLGVFMLGFLLGKMLGWTSMESTFLGGLLSMSSTVVVIKTYGDLGLMKKPWAGIVFGTLVVEDLIAILLMVLLSTLAVSKHFSGGELLLNLAKLLFFLVLWFIVGIYLIPTILKKTAKYISDEILLIISLGLCFGMVTLATDSGFSSALGAFMMGSILAETIEGDHIDKLLTPIKNLFGAVFFVSVGMMIDPKVIASQWLTILILSLFVVITHVFFACAGVVTAGGNLKNGVHTGFSLAQLGEFGFIIAGVGVNLGVMRDFIYPVIIAVSVLTIFTTPYTIKLADPAYSWLQKHIHQSLLSRIDRPDDYVARSTAEKSEWAKYITSFAIKVLIYTVLLVAVYIVSASVLNPLLDKLLPETSPWIKDVIGIGTTFVAMTPFLYGLVISNHGMQKFINKLLHDKRSNILPILGFDLVRLLIAAGMILAVVSIYVELAAWLVVFTLVCAVIYFILGRHYFHHYTSLEDKFMENYNEKENRDRRLRPVTSSVHDSLSPYNVGIEEVIVPPDSEFVGKKLSELPIRQQSGANIIKITRGNIHFNIPTGDQVIYPYDKLYAVGTHDQVDALQALVHDSAVSPEARKDVAFSVEPIKLWGDSFLTGKTLREANLRKHGCMIISILKNGDFITNPKPDILFETGDTVWLAGDVGSLDWMK